MLLLPSAWRRDALRTNLWFVPMLEVLGAIVLFLVTHAVDAAAWRGTVKLPSWVIFGSADAARTVLTALAASVITVVGIVFSITIVTLTLASTQFGPRMLRNFIRDRGTQFTLGTFVATFVYATLVLISIGPGNHVPHLSITVSVVLVMVSMGVLIYFIHHIAASIQLPNVIASIAGDLSRAIDAESVGSDGRHEAGPSVAELLLRMGERGGEVQAPASGYLQFIRHDLLVGLAAERGAVIRLLHRPGHFIVRGHPIASVWPPEAAPSVSRALRRAHITGTTRTLVQDLAFAVDQLVEIAIRALSPAVNDTFTAMTCIDWLGESLVRVTTSWRPLRVQRDSHGFVRVITAEVSYTRLVERAFEKIRQAAAGMPAVLIRQLEALEKIMYATTTAEQRELLLAQARMIRRLSDETIGEAMDRADVEREYSVLQDLAARVELQGAQEMRRSQAANL
ncbi:MAG: DUF2254 domain-containing protein [Solirubrobacteraceae bacterium]